MSYLVEGPLTIVLGLGLVLIVPFGGLIAIAIGIAMTVAGAKNEQPGTHPARCHWGGHDWRKDLPNYYPGPRCRNCLKLKGSPNVPPNVGYARPFPPGFYPPPPAYVPPGYSPYAPPPVYAPFGAPPGYAPYPVAPPIPIYAVPAPSMPVARAVAAPQPAPPAIPALCPSCRSPVRPGVSTCPWCERSFA